MLNSNDILGLIEIDENAKKVFLSMPREEQLLAILGMQSFTRSELANIIKKQYEFEEQLKQFQRQTTSYRAYRERKEKSNSIDDDNEDVLNITDKIVKGVRAELAQRFDVWVYLRDKVLPQLLTMIIIAILALTFANKLP